MAFRIEPITSDMIEDMGRLLGTDRAAGGCWCMWFIIPVKDYHSAGSGGNRASFCGLMAASRQPLGLLAYQEGEAVGWCAVGPRSRYRRALRTPTYLGRDPGEDDSVWLVPCFFVRRDVRRAGLGQMLLQAAVGLAKEHGARAIEGFSVYGRKAAQQRHAGRVGIRVFGVWLRGDPHAFAKSCHHAPRADQLILLWLVPWSLPDRLGGQVRSLSERTCA
jgi:GNAT superfamily N-acetyltransferase